MRGDAAMVATQRFEREVLSEAHELFREKHTLQVARVRLVGVASSQENENRAKVIALRLRKSVLGSRCLVCRADMVYDPYSAFVLSIRLDESDLVPLFFIPKILVNGKEVGMFSAELSQLLSNDYDTDKWESGLLKIASRPPFKQSEWGSSSPLTPSFRVSGQVSVLGPHLVWLTLYMNEEDELAERVRSALDTGLRCREKETGKRLTWSKEDVDWMFEMSNASICSNV